MKQHVTKWPGIFDFESVSKDISPDVHLCHGPATSSPQPCLNPSLKYFPSFSSSHFHHKALNNFPFDSLILKEHATTAASFLTILLIHKR
jgi:hypothetical protein